MNVMAVIAGNSFDLVPAHVPERKASLFAFAAEYRVRRRDGSEIWVQKVHHEAYN